MKKLGCFFISLGFLAGCNATVNGPFLKHVKAEKKQAKDLTYVADQLIQFPDLKSEERENLRWQMRKVQSEVEAVSKISDIVRRHIVNPWWTDWFFPFDGWGETPFYVNQSAIDLNHLTQQDIRDLKTLVDETEKRFDMKIPLPSEIAWEQKHPKHRNKHLDADGTPALRWHTRHAPREQQRAEKAQKGKITDPFTQDTPPDVKRSQEMEQNNLPALPEIQPEIKDFLEEKEA